MNEVRIFHPRKSVSDEVTSKIELSILHYVYSQIKVALIASLFCAGIIFIGLYNNTDQQQLILWSVFFILVTVLRLLSVFTYSLDREYEKRVALWRNIYIIGSLLGGLTWGVLGVMFLPHATPAQQMLLILMLAGVTAGVIPLSAAIPYAAVAFLIFAVVPFIFIIAISRIDIPTLFNLALFVYLLYCIYMVVKNHRLIENFLALTLENDSLLHKLRITNKSLEVAATHDPLTHIANRRLFESSLKASIDHAKKHNQPLALLFFDLDNFKNINDTYGHESGDHTLLMVISRLNAYFRKEDIISRMGGDEFAVIIDNFKSKNDIVVIASKICSLITEPIHLHGDNLNITASIGISMFPENGHTERDLLKKADIAMYVVKENGGNNFKFF